jgi:hypothetical protein
MAKNKNPEPKPTSVPAPRSSASERIAAPTALPVARATGGPDESGPGLVEQVGRVTADTARMVHAVLPSRAPAYLGAGALVLAGLIDLPAALAGGLAYEALRRWAAA